MSSPNRQPSVCLIVAATLLCWAAGAAGQVPTKESKDTREVAAYKLTTEGLTKYVKVAKALDELSKKEPSLKEKELLSSDNGQKTIDETVQVYERYPQVISAIKSAAFTPREFVVFTYALMTNSFALAFKQAGMLKDLPPGTSAANIDFIEKHQKEIKALGGENERKPPENNPEPR